jgi:Leucine-rich repeat (LRR) protein
MKILFLFSAILFMTGLVQGEPCTDYACDSLTVRAILDSNGMVDVTVKEVTGSNTARIDSLDLAGREIDVLPASIGKLSGLKYLMLGCIRYSGVPRDPICNTLESLPEEIGNLKELVYLDVDGNQLAELPLSIGELHKLETLRLEYNQLVSLPSAIGQLHKLDYLVLDYNPIVTLPDEIGMLTSLRSMDLFATDIQSLPNTIGNLKKLEFIHIAKTKLKILPDEFCNLSSLKQAELYGNKLESLPDSLVKLTNLNMLFVTNNRLCSLSNDLQVFLDKYDPGWDTLQDCSAAARKPVTISNPIVISDIKRLPGLIEISCHLNERSSIRVEIFNGQGKLLHHVSGENRVAGFHILNIRLEKIVKGVLFIRITGESSAVVNRHLILN